MTSASLIDAIYRHFCNSHCVSKNIEYGFLYDFCLCVLSSLCFSFSFSLCFVVGLIDTVVKCWKYWRNNCHMFKSDNTIDSCTKNYVCFWIWYSKSKLKIFLMIWYKILLWQSYVNSIDSLSMPVFSSFASCMQDSEIINVL